MTPDSRGAGGREASSENSRGPEGAPQQGHGMGVGVSPCGLFGHGCGGHLGTLSLDEVPQGPKLGKEAAESPTRKGDCTLFGNRCLHGHQGRWANWSKAPPPKPLVPQKTPYLERGLGNAGAPATSKINFGRPGGMFTGTGFKVI